jgi:hypothetical protein
MSWPDTLDPRPSFIRCEQTLKAVSAAIRELTAQMRLLNLRLAESDRAPTWKYQRRAEIPAPDRQRPLASLWHPSTILSNDRRYERNQGN